jgi:hypothetical protein
LSLLKLEMAEKGKRKMTTPSITNDKTIAEWDAIIAEATAAKQALAEGKIDELLVRIESECADLNTTPKQLLASFVKRSGPGRRGRPRKDNGAAAQSKGE